MKFNSIIVLSYGIIVLAGGLIGYFSAGSLPSLFSGILFGALLLWSSWGLFRMNIPAFYTALASSGILSLFFGFRYYVTGSMVPAGSMAIFSVIVFLLLVSSKNPRYLRP